MNAARRLLLALPFCLFTAGCGSILNRENLAESRYTGIYSAVRFESQYMADPGPSEPIAAILFAWLDFPFTLTLDTVLLPFDALVMLTDPSVATHHGYVAPPADSNAK